MVNESSSQYTVLARRFRPKSFAEVVGQEHVGQAIQNAIRSGRVAHAYLFTGARGVGKTSTARIFAKALNCPNTKEGIPCNACDVCERIAAGNDVDVLEIDGASNRGIDDIRQLRANVNVRSMRSPYKVYIIDEVHMLTKEAFNALLKTLEEPPANVKFVFCTTEPNKVPDTILSRCQRFDFGTIDARSIAGRLQQIAEAEGKTVDDDAIELIARRAAGSMRDSQSLFDQLLAFGGEQITAEDVHRLLGTAADDRLIGLVESMIEGQPAAALQAVQMALEEGVQIGGLSDQLLAYLRDLMVTSAGAGEVALSAVTESSRERVQQQAQRWGLQTIVAAMQILAETKAKMQRVSYGRALLELAVVRLASLEQLDRLGELAAELRGGPSAPTIQGNQTRSESLKKKFEVTFGAPVASPSPSASPKSASGVSQTAKKRLTEATLGEFWEELLGKVPEKLALHLKNASKRAIIGPSRLEIAFPRSYLFSKSYCESQDPCQKLTATISELAGESIQCCFAVDQESAPPVPVTKSTPRSAVPERRRPAAVEKDEFVQQAVGIFGGQVIEVRPLATEVESEAEVDEQS